MIFFYCKYNLNTPTEAHCCTKLCLPWHALASLAKLKKKIIIIIKAMDPRRWRSNCLVNCLMLILLTSLPVLSAPSLTIKK